MGFGVWTSQTRGKFPRSIEDWAAFRRYATAVAHRFVGRDVRFEIWNEPDITLGDPKVFALLVKEGAAAIHDGNPDAQVSSGGLARMTNNEFLEELMNSQSLRNVEAFGVHPYRSGMPETVGSDLQDLQTKVSRTNRGNLQIWDTEWGYSSYSDEIKKVSGAGHTAEAEWRQAVLGVREILSAWASGFPAIVWYDLVDDNDNPVDPEGNYGLLRIDRTPKPVFRSIKTLSDLAAGRTYSGLVGGLVSGSHGMRLQNRAELLFIVWNTNRQLPVDMWISRRNLLSVENVVGSEMQVSETADGNLALKLAESIGPVYIRYKLLPIQRKGAAE